MLSSDKTIDPQFFVEICVAPILEKRKLKKSPMEKMLQVSGLSIFRGCSSRRKVFLVTPAGASDSRVSSTDQ